MNKIINKFLLSGDKFVPRMHLRQTGFTYNTWGRFTKIKKRIQKFKETWNLQYFSQKELDKAWFEYDMAYGNFKDLPRRTTSNQLLESGKTKSTLIFCRQYFGY